LGRLFKAKSTRGLRETRRCYRLAMLWPARTAINGGKRSNFPAVAILYNNLVTVLKGPTLSERPISEFWKAHDGKAAEEPSADEDARRDDEQSDESLTSLPEDNLPPDASDSIWDPESKPDQAAKHRQLLAQLPDRSLRANPEETEKTGSPATVLRHIPQSPPLSDARFISAFPQRTRKQPIAKLFWFAICVLLPMAGAWNYYSRVASKQYASEFRFTVKDASAQATAASATNGLLAILGTAGTTSNNNYVVVDYLTSREVVDALEKRIGITHLYAKPEIDWWSRYDDTKPIESFVRYWHSIVTTNFDQVTGIATAEVRAFSPQDALLIANEMVKLSEELVNNVFNRSQLDAVRFSQAEVDKAEQRLKVVRERLTVYRNAAGVIDPNTSVVASSSNLIQSLQATLAQQEAQLATMLRQRLLPNAPTVIVLKNQIQSTKEQLAAVERSIGKKADGTPLSKVMSEYEQLDLERQFSQTMLTSALQALDQARANAAAQHLYITPYVRPSLPMTSTYPDRFFSVLKVGALAFVFWLIALLTVRSISERYA
jgi:capsular polysaccharide transport system permease protein